MYKLAELGWNETIETDRTRLFLAFHFLPVACSMCIANSLAIVSMLLALSQVTWPICHRDVEFVGYYL